MGWIGPQQCKDHCCGPPTPCPPPRVTCKRYLSGEYGQPGYLEYTIENADEAWIRQQCGSVITDFPIELTGGAASGRFEIGDGEEIEPASISVVEGDECYLTVFARNECDTVTCTDICDQPVCSITAERVTSFMDEFPFSYFSSVKIKWSYRNTDIPYATADQIVSAEINGMDVFGSPISQSGEFDVLEPTDLDEFYEITVTNDCGRVKKCRIDIPCCWRRSLLRLTVSGVGDVSRSCVDDTVTFVPRITGGANRIYHREAQIEITGLSSLNGTHFFDLQKFTCSPIEGRFEHLGTITARRRGYVEYEITTTGAIHSVEIISEIDLDIGTPFLTGSPLTNRTIRHTSVNGSAYRKVTNTEFPALSYEGMVCINDGPWPFPIPKMEPCNNKPIVSSETGIVGMLSLSGWGAGCEDYQEWDLVVSLRPPTAIDEGSGCSFSPGSVTQLQTFKFEYI
jgi:hypothetical protein